MADQASVSGNGARSAEAPIEGVVGNIAEFGNDVATLIELQSRLAVLDLKESAEKALVPLATVTLATALVLASLPVALLGLGELLATALKIGRGESYLIVAVAVLVLGGLAAAIAAMRLRRSFEVFRRSREELVRNINWIRTVLMYSGRAMPRSRR
jgi:uncharacterized membrane protein YqjE